MTIIYYLAIVGLTTGDDYSSQFYNQALDSANPDSVWPPSSDNGEQQSFKYPFSFTHRSLYSAGWARQVNVNDLPIAKNIAGVQMKLIAGGIREMHWHASDEWAYVIEGQCRVTIVSPEAKGRVADIKQSDLWFFPSGWAHSIQGIGKDGCFFILAFNKGDFNDFDKFQLTDYLIHTPHLVTDLNFATTGRTFARLPKSKLYIFPSQLPGPLEKELAAVAKGTGLTPPITFDTTKIEPNVTRTGGSVKIIDRRNFPLTTMASAILTINPGGMREMHWHPNADEWGYLVRGQARITTFAANGEARTMDFQEGDVSYVPRAMGHYIQNTGNTTVTFLEVFPTPYFADMSLATWLAHTPEQLVDAHLHTGARFLDGIYKEKAVFRPL
ncbi:oxalate decarboxylase OxdC-like [Oppia nitens]|uniref:oxalate decarboxylase OxdC-like n=1 Tax=Oppia nitens TaxID=1686743 RepID=UPI0023DA0169|nr:oxalate decarboxylase OxdC-like [Oppia nitens]